MSGSDPPAKELNFCYYAAGLNYHFFCRRDKPRVGNRNSVRANTVRPHFSAENRTSV